VLQKEAPNLARELWAAGIKVYLVQHVQVLIFCVYFLIPIFHFSYVTLQKSQHVPKLIRQVDLLRFLKKLLFCAPVVFCQSLLKTSAHA
jgi:hypothetical protein